MKLLSFLALFLICSLSYANINYIDMSKISNDSKHIAAYNDIKANLKYYSHWTVKWDYDKSREDLINTLRTHYKSFSTLRKKSEELNLLLGEIAHYLYNLDDSAYFRIAVKHYLAANNDKSPSYRAYWFLGNHYALANKPNEAYDAYQQAIKCLPKQHGGDFWNQYAMALYLAHMPSTCMYAMEMAKKAAGGPASFEQSMKDELLKKQFESFKDSTYNIRDLWQFKKGEKNTFISRPLGLSLLIDSTWGVLPFEYKKQQAAFVISPPTIKNNQGTDIKYSIGFMMRVADESEKLEEYVNKITGNKPGKRASVFTDKYAKSFLYELKDPNMYQHMGGGHSYLLAIERDSPLFPGMLLEQPITLRNNKGEKVGYHTFAETRKRFNGRIFYAIMLDSCEDIHEESFNIFKKLLNEQVVIE